MNLRLPTIGLDRYKSASQRARVGTESWGASNFFCPVCDSPRLDVAPYGTATLDYSCPRCNSPFQLKSQSKPFGAKILDSAYSQMKRAILSDETPNLYVLHYDLSAWAVRTVILIPHFAFALSAIEVRPPLAPTARRAGWIGCNILLHKIPADARIPIVSDGAFCSPTEVRRAYKRLRPLEKLQVKTRGWTLDVLNVVRSLSVGRAEATPLRSRIAERGRAEATPLQSRIAERGRAEATPLRSRIAERGRAEATPLQSRIAERGRAEATPPHQTFTLADVYAHDDELACLHPGNRHVRDKIRQQLQVLRDIGLLEFLGGGSYRLR